MRSSIVVLVLVVAVAAMGSAILCWDYGGGDAVPVGTATPALQTDANNEFFEARIKAQGAFVQPIPSEIAVPVEERRVVQTPKVRPGA